MSLFKKLFPFIFGNSQIEALNEQIESLKITIDHNQNIIFQQKININSYIQEIDCNKSYINACEDIINRFNKKIKSKQFKTKEVSTTVSSKIVLFTPDWNKCTDSLPISSFSEILVCDGNIVGVAAYDAHNRAFLKTFGAQTMKVPFPKYWRYLPAPAFPDDTTKSIENSMNGHGIGLEICYNR